VTIDEVKKILELFNMTVHEAFTRNGELLGYRVAVSASGSSHVGSLRSLKSLQRQAKRLQKAVA